jgi:hypothetical protein
MKRALHFLLALGIASSADAAFARRKPIVIDNTRVMGASDLADFPVLVSLVDANLQAAVTSPLGYDIAFRAEDDATCGGPGFSPCVLDHEIETWDPATGALSAWVRVPLLSTSVNTTIYIYYGDAAITCPQESPRGVWDSDFREVFHLDETGDHTDSTANGYTAAARGTVGQNVTERAVPETSSSARRRRGQRLRRFSPRTPVHSRPGSGLRSLQAPAYGSLDRRDDLDPPMIGSASS